MIQGSRKPVSYGKPTRRYLLSENREKPQQRRLWRDTSSNGQESNSSSPEATGAAVKPQEYDFDVPLSEGESAALPLSRPNKKRKLTPPLTSKPVAGTLTRVSKAKALGGGRKTPSASSQQKPLPADDFDVPLSDEETYGATRKTVSSLARDPLASKARPLPDSRAHLHTHSTAQKSQMSAPSMLRSNGPGKTSNVAPRAHDHTIRERRTKETQSSTDVESLNMTGRSQDHSRGLKTTGQLRKQAVKPSLKSAPKVSKAPDLRCRTPPRTPPDDTRNGMLSSSQPRAHRAVNLTPGVLNMMDLCVDDSTSRKLATNPRNEVSKAANDSELPRRKLKDRLASNASPRRRSPPCEVDDHEQEVNVPVSNLHKPDTPLREGILDVDLRDTILGRRKVTYSRQRSHLSVAQEDEAASWSVPLEDGLSSSTGRRLQLTASQEKPFSQSYADEILEEEDDLSEQPLKSVHELRAAGGARRTGILLEAFFDDIEAASSVGSARGAVFQLALKLLEPEFPAEFVRHGSLSKIFTLTLRGNDTFINSTYAIALLQVLPLAPIAEFDGKGHIVMLLHKFASLLDGNVSLLKASKVKTSNMSRAQQADLARICRLVMSSLMLDDTDNDTITPRLIGLKGLDVCIRRLRQAGYMHQLVDAVTFSHISQILSSEDEDSSTTATSSEIYLAISALESLSIGEFVGNGTPEQRILESAIANIAASLPAFIISGRDYYSNELSLLLRLCLNLSTRAVSSCRIFARRKITSTVVVMIKEGFELVESAPLAEKCDLIIDILVLGLGFLANLTEEFPDCRQNFVRCTPGRAANLHTLLELFRSRQDTAASAVTESETKANVAFGYLAVLLCSLCLDDDIRKLVATELKDKKLLKLREAMAQFVVFHRTIDMATETEQGEVSKSQALFVDRLQHVLSALNSACIA